MMIGRTLLAAVTIAAVTAAAATPLTDSVAWARRRLKNTAGKLKLRSSLSRGVRDKLRGTIKASRRPEERHLIELPGQSQTVRMKALDKDLADCGEQHAMQLVDLSVPQLDRGTYL